MRIEPLSDRLLIQQDKKEEVSKGGIILPGTAADETLQGLVIAAGPGKYSDEGHLIPMKVKQGDRVIFDKNAGTEVKDDDGTEYLIIHEDDVTGIVCQNTAQG